MNIVLLGPQGSGKGTQGKLLSKQLNIPHISTGDMLRAYAEQDTPKAKEVRALMQQGELVDDHFLEHILQDRLTRPDCEQGFILDGTPRDVEQAQLLEAIVSVDVAVLIDITEEESYKRIHKRAKQEGRADDTDEGLKERLHVYHERTEPVLAHYEEQGKLVRVDGMQSVEDVFSALCKQLGLAQ